MAVTSLTAVLTLSGCFVIPLADGRSPFDDPFGTSNSDITRAMPDVLAALESVNAQSDWTVDATTGSENCEGPCSLYVRVWINPPEDAERNESTVPTELLREVLIAVVPVTEKHRVNLGIDGGYGGEDMSLSADIAPAAQQLFGTIPKEGLQQGSFNVRLEQTLDPAIYVFTRKYVEVLPAMGLD